MREGERLESPSPISPDAITPRQREVAKLVADGLTNGEIAAALGITLDGAKYHVSELLTRLGLERRDEVAAWYRAHFGRIARVRSFLRAIVGLPMVGIAAGGVGAAGAVAVTVFAVVGIRGGIAAPDVTGPPEYVPFVQSWEMDETGEPLHGTLEWNGCGDWLLTVRDEVGNLLNRARGQQDLESADGQASCHIPGVWFRPMSNWQIPADGRRQLGPFEYEMAYPRDCSELSNPPDPDGPLGPDFCADPQGTFEDRVVAAFDPDTEIPMRYSQYVDGVLEFEYRATNLTLLDEPSDLTSPFAEWTGHRIDTGFGWSYVIDRLSDDGPGITLAYHVEGDIDGLQASMTNFDPNTIDVPFPADGRSAEMMIDWPQTDVVTLAFGGAVRALDAEVVLRLSSSPQAGWAAPEVITEAPGIESVTVIEEQPGFISVRVISPTAFTGSGSLGNFATLSDDRGRTYELFHGSASPQDRASLWDFVGPLPADVSTLTLTIPGAVQVEPGPWHLSLTPP